MSTKTIMSEEDVRRTLRRMAHEIIERHHNLSEVVLVGLRTRGVPLANRLAAYIQSYENITLPVGALDIILHRDDRQSPDDAQPVVERTNIPVDINGKAVILVDDVLYTGRSIRAAMDALIELGRPRLIQLAVLIDRGHREMPIRPDYVGKNIPSARDEDIEVRLGDLDGVDEVAILKSNDHADDPIRSSNVCGE